MPGRPVGGANGSVEVSESVVRGVRGRRRVIRWRFMAPLQVIRWRFVAPLLALVLAPPAALLLDGDPRGALIAGIISVAAAIFGYKDFAKHSLRDRG
jgi:hypothetical protein